MKNVSWVVKNGLCTSCGICAGACTKKCITFNYGSEINTPIVDKNACVECGLCYDVCPGKGIHLNNLSSSLFGQENGIVKDLCIGHYLHCYVGHSNDENIRMHCATGGMVTQFLTWLLKKKYIDGAVVVRYSKDNPFYTEPFIATTEEEIWESRSSKYVVLSMDKISPLLSKMKGSRLVVVGLPCQIQGWRQLAKVNKTVRDVIVGYFSIYCSVNKTKHSLLYYPWKYNVNPKEVGRFTFRDDGCMGYMKFCDKSGNEIKKIPYKDFWLGTHSFFVNSRCLLCVDQLGELADMSFGDIHIEPYSNDKIGTNSIITRSSKWEMLLKECKEEGFVSLEEISADILVKSQKYTNFFKKGAGLKTNMLIRKWMGKSNPVYDYHYDGRIRIKFLISEIVKSFMRLIGHHRSMWFIVRFFDRS